MKYMNYLFVFTFAFSVFNTTLFAQEEAEDVSLQIMPLPVYSEDGNFGENYYEYNYNYPSPYPGINVGELLFHFQAEEAGLLAIAVEGGIEDSVTLVNLYDQYNQHIQQLNVGHTPNIKQGFLIIPNPGRYTVGVQYQVLEVQQPPEQQQEEAGVSALVQESPDEDENDLNAFIRRRFNQAEQVDASSDTNPDSDQGDSSDEQSPPMIRVESSFLPASMPPSDFASFVVGDKDNDENPGKATGLISEEGAVEITATVGGLDDLWDWWRIEEGFNMSLTVQSVNGDVLIRVYDNPELVENDENWRTIDDDAIGTEEFTIRPQQEGIEGPVFFKIRPFSRVTRPINYIIKVQTFAY